MEYKHADLIRGLSDDVSYMRGQWDAVIPEIKKSSETVAKILDIHSTRITEVELMGETNKENIEKESGRADRLEGTVTDIKMKVAIAGSFSGVAAAVFTNWLLKKFGL